MWQNYFFQIQSKYSMRVSFNNPLVIRLDGKNVTKSDSYDLLNNYDGSFLNSLERTVKYFTEKYHCLAIFGSDEVSFIFQKPMTVIRDLDKDEVNRTSEIISLFSQYFFDYFNSLNLHSKIFWHGKCFSIKEEKINSYLKFRSKIIKNVMTTYFLKKNGKRMGNSKIEEKELECKKLPNYENLEKIQNGILYFDGKEIDLEEFYNGNMKIIDNAKEDAFDSLSEFGF